MPLLRERASGEGAPVWVLLGLLDARVLTSPQARREARDNSPQPLELTMGLTGYILSAPEAAPGAALPALV